MQNTHSITLDTAREIAANDARETFSTYIPDHLLSPLDPVQLEAENCWMFFLHKDVCIPPESRLGLRWAFVVSKQGSTAMVQDLSDDAEKVHAYVNTMSEYFKRNGL